jgi:NADPH:quinone reductase-like Zn-dependent oxidoreductase
VRAVVCRELGPPSLLAIEERDDPRAGPGQVVVAVEAAGVLGIDWGIWSMQHGDRPLSLVADLLAMVSDGTLDPVPPTCYPLDDVAVALEHLLTRQVVGKVALIP